MQRVPVASVLEWGPNDAPVGAVLDETIGHLEQLDQQMLLFSAGSCVVAIRWLLHTGANWEVTDSHGTTCLHAACRSGDIPMVVELMKRDSLIEATDNFSWTPLHVAAHMGRHMVALKLLEAKASPHKRNILGQTPLQICVEQETRKILMEDWPRQTEVVDNRADRETTCTDSLGVPVESEPEFFFVPPQAAMSSMAPSKQDLVLAAVLMFNVQPGYGLGFLVATGLSDSYTEAMKTILDTGQASRLQTGSFLGTTLSVCRLIRFSIFDSVALLHTGIVSALVQAFSALQLPEDLQMAARLVHSVAQVWWLKHKKGSHLLESDSSSEDQFVCAPPPSKANTKAKKPRMPEEAKKPRMPDEAETRQGRRRSNSRSGQSECRGLELIGSVANADTLAQLMLSTVLLHWFVHGNGKEARRELSLEVWLSVNQGLGVPIDVLSRIHSLVVERFLWQLALASRDSGFNDTVAVICGVNEPEDGHSCWQIAPDDVLSHQEPRRSDPLDPLRPMMSKCASHDSWAKVLGNSLPLSTSALVSHFALSEATCRFADCGGGRVKTSIDSARTQCNASQASGAPGSLADGFVWASLCTSLLLLSARPSVPPHALMDIKRTHLVRPVPDSKILSFTGLPEDATAVEERTYPLSVVVLLPDGRWQELRLSKLDIQMETEEDVQKWLKLAGGWMQKGKA